MVPTVDGTTIDALLSAKQITPANGLAKQGFSATGKWFYRIEVFCGILHRKILDSANPL
jgi:hypothetical protein